MFVNVKRLQAKMDEEGLDGIVAATLPNVYYFASYWSEEIYGFPYDGQCYAVVTRDEPDQPFIVSPTAELDIVLDGFPVRGAVGVGKFYREEPFGDIQLTKDELWLKSFSMDQASVPGPIDGLLVALDRLGLVNKKVGLDELGLLDGFFEEISKRSPGTQFTKVSKLLRLVRRVKTPDEVKRMREVVHITENAMIAATSIARVGITEYEMAREFEHSIISQGATPRFTYLHFGRNGVAGQRNPDRTPLKIGDTIWFDTGAVYKGYWSDIARTFALGKPSERAQKIYAALLEGEKAGIAGTCAGMTGNDIYEMVMKASREADLPSYRRQHVGHGIGAECYESPLLAPGNQDVIEVGTVVNIETPYYEFGLGALHVEDPFLVKANGEHELLTTLSRDLNIIEPR